MFKEREDSQSDWNMENKKASGRDGAEAATEMCHLGPGGQAGSLAVLPGARRCKRGALSSLTISLGSRRGRAHQGGEAGVGLTAVGHRELGAGHSYGAGESDSGSLPDVEVTRLPEGWVVSKGENQEWILGFRSN